MSAKEIQPKAKLEAAAAAPEAAMDESSGSLDPQDEQIQKLQAERDDLKSTLIRRQADFENFRKRVEKERHAERRRGLEQMLEQLLPVLDAFDLAFSSNSKSVSPDLLKGFDLTRRQLWDVLAKQGVERIEAVGKEFNPHLHHALERVETTEFEDGIVIAELQPGYAFHDRVLRPAMVRVAAVPSGSN